MNMDVWLYVYTMWVYIYFYVLYIHISLYIYALCMYVSMYIHTLSYRPHPCKLKYFVSSGIFCEKCQEILA